MRKTNIFWGMILILIGVLFLANKFYDFDIISMKNLWPLFILIPGLAFEFQFFSTGKNPGVLVPGGILTTIGILFLFETATNFHFAEYTWPIYPLSVAIGLFQLYLFSGRHPGLLIPVFILGGISIISFTSMIYGRIVSSLIFPVILITTGLYIIFRGLRK